MKRNTFLIGTLWLSGAGLATRLLGFVYRIYLSNTVGSEGMGLYQLLMPIYFLLLTLVGSGITTAICRLVALHRASSSHSMTRIVLAGLLPVLLLSLTLSLLLYRHADWAAAAILHDARTAAGLRILCLSLPFCAVSSCCKAYFHGQGQMTVPAIDQVLEQCVRMATLWFLLPLLRADDLSYSCCLVVTATAVGDIVASLYAAGAFVRSASARPSVSSESYRRLWSMLFPIALPITGGRLLIQLLSCLENILLPSALQRFGYTSSEALSLLGVYSGMVLPILFFPSLLTGSVSANLLPLAASAQSAGNLSRIRHCIERVVRFTLLFSFLCTVLLGSLGDCLGALLYPGTEAGALLVLLSLFCPFLYLQGTLSGLLSGLGLQNSVFMHQLFTSAITALTILLLVPRYGFGAFLGGYFFSLCVGTVLNLYPLLHTFGASLRFFHTILLPWLSCMAVIGLIRSLRLLIGDRLTEGPLALALVLVSASLLYLLFLRLSGALAREDRSQLRKLFE